MNDKTLSLAIPLIPLTLYKSTIITYNYLKYLASDLINAKLITIELNKIKYLHLDLYVDGCGMWMGVGI